MIDKACHLFVDIRLHFSYQLTNLAHEGRLPEGKPESGASAVLPLGFAIRAGAALGIMPSGITTGARGAVTGLGQGRAGNARCVLCVRDLRGSCIGPSPRKHGLELSHDVRVVARAACEAPEGERAPSR